MAMRRATVAIKDAVSIFRSQSRSYHPPGWKSNKELDAIYKTTMDHLPKPEGSWAVQYKAKDQKATTFFVGSVVVFLLTIMEMEREGCFDLLSDPACWSDKQVERQARYYAKGEKWRKKPEDDE